MIIVVKVYREWYQKKNRAEYWEDLGKSKDQSVSERDSLVSLLRGAQIKLFL